MALAVSDEHPVHDRDAKRIDQFLQLLEQAAGIGLLGGIIVSAHQQRASTIFSRALISNIAFSYRTMEKMHP